MCVLIFSFCNLVFSQDPDTDPQVIGYNSIFKEASKLFEQGKYRGAIDELNQIISKNEKRSTILGRAAYWKGICFNRLQNFPEAIENFDKALGLDFSQPSLHYEYGQALFAADKLDDARNQFAESLKKNFKRGVSLYYIAFITKELGETQRAITFFKALQKLDESEWKEVRQAAEMQIGDLYLQVAEEHVNAFTKVENQVIPQYQIAYKLDKDSNLAPMIKEKITTLQKKYNLVLFKLRNGRATLIPPYFARVALESGIDSNVVFSPTELNVSESKKKSSFVKTDIMGRYTFYHQNYLSVSPEFKFNYSRYLNRKPEIYRNDNYLFAPALRTAHEHTLWLKPASLLMDYDYSESKRDVNSEEKLTFSFRSHTLMVGERFNYFSFGESIVRIRKRFFDSYINASDSNTTSLSVEQTSNLTSSTLLFYASYDRTRVRSDIFNTDAFTLRADIIAGQFRDWFSPSFGMGITNTKPLNNSTRGNEFLFNPSGRLSRTIKKNLRGSLKFDYQDYKSEDSANFAYKRYMYSFEVEYLF